MNHFLITFLFAVLTAVSVQVVSAQTEPAQTVPAQVTPVQTGPQRWASVGAATRFSGSGLTLSYGQKDLLSPGTDARFSANYTNSDPFYAGGGFTAELSADALAYTYDPDPERGLALVAYGGLGPRLLVQPVYIYYSPDTPLGTAYGFNIGAVGGLEARLGTFGLFLELDVSLPAFGLIGPYFRVFPTEAFPAPKLTLGANYFF